MHNVYLRAGLLMAATTAVGCGNTGQPILEHNAYATGTLPRAVAVKSWEAKLDVARVGFGPATFCASREASEELCSNALAEFADSANFDALSSTPQLLGRIQGFAGTIHSAGYGFAWTWAATQTEPRPTSKAVSGHSVHLEGTATSPTKTLRFLADIDVLPTSRGTFAVTANQLNATIGEATRRADLVVDPNAWLVDVDFDELSTTASDTVQIVAGSRAHTAIVVAMTAIAPPKFSWNTAP